MEARWQALSIGAAATRHAAVAAAVICLGLVAPAQAQVSSEAKGTLTLEVGRGWGPFGNVASQVAEPGTDVPRSTVHANGFRMMAGYHFAEYLAVEIGLARLGSFDSSAPYLGNDVLNSYTNLITFEGDVVGYLPLAARLRLALTLGVTDSGLHTTLTTHNGNALPLGELGDQNVHRFGATGGLDFEIRLTDVTSFVIGYHAYTRNGSAALRDSPSGTANAIFGGLHFEF